jgi:hypothetical protein
VQVRSFLLCKYIFAYCSALFKQVRTYIRIFGVHLVKMGQ